MKKLILFAILTIFLASMLNTSAYAHTCPNQNKTAEALMNSDMPCHKKNQTPKNCDGLCICLHASLSQTLMISELETTFHTPDTKKIWTMTQDVAPSLSAQPPRRPPKIYS